MPPLFFEPVFKERIWGGTALRDFFGYEIPSERTGECWAISAHPHGESTVKNGPFTGWTLSRLWREHRELFGNHPADRFPLLTKILDAKTDLSVQVHPDDHYAQKMEHGEQGKTECWYIIDCANDAEIVYGHAAQTREELEAMLREERWDELLLRVPVRPGDFFFLPSGTVHAIGGGMLVWETQQSSDTTYRIYDYDRIDADGKKRELHLDKALDVITVPHTKEETGQVSRSIPGATITQFVRCPYFSVEKWEIEGEASFSPHSPFTMASVIKGSGTLSHASALYPLRAGDHFILPKTLDSFTLNGCMVVMIAQP